jgi:hypothetical protein
MPDNYIGIFGKTGGVVKVKQALKAFKQVS